MAYRIHIQKTNKTLVMPTAKKLKEWASLALNEKAEAEITIRIVTKEEMQSLNLTYRQKDKPTNVLSFPLSLANQPLFGDIVICADIVKEEAISQGKPLEAHWAHLVIHGVLHLLGHDHEQEQDAEIMEAKEIALLHSIGFSNPYQITQQGETNESRVR